MRIHQKQSPAPRARRQKQSPYGPKGKSVAVAVEWQHDFLREKVNMAVFMQRVQFIGLRVMRCLSRVCHYGICLD